MTPIPEPMADVRAQVAAMLDPTHPKKAALVVPGNEVPAVLADVIRVDRPSGTLLTLDPVRAAAFADGHDHDATMAWILGYPEDKGSVVAACGGDPVRTARAIQARDADGNVVTEAFTSPTWFDRTYQAIGEHVPAGGHLVVLTPTQAIGRRVVLRLVERANG